MMPMPPSRASAIARRASVTVSIAADTSGIVSGIVRVRRVSVETSLGRMSRVGRHEQHVVEREPLGAELLLAGAERNVGGKGIEHQAVTPIRSCLAASM